MIIKINILYDKPGSQVWFHLDFSKFYMFLFFVLNSFALKWLMTVSIISKVFYSKCYSDPLPHPTFRAEEDQVLSCDRESRKRKIMGKNELRFPYSYVWVTDRGNSHATKLHYMVGFSTLLRLFLPIGN
jgi:hypothetical protein